MLALPVQIAVKLFNEIGKSGDISKIFCEKVTNRNQARQSEELFVGFICKSMCVRWRLYAVCWSLACMREKSSKAQ